MPKNLEKIIDGKIIAGSILSKVKNKIDKLTSKPDLAVILVGNDIASKTYVNKKIQTCNEVGIKSHAYHLPQETTEKELLELVCSLNENNEIDGILVQLPLPAQINSSIICDHISPLKDVDGLNSLTLGKILTKNKNRILPCTPRGIMHILVNELKEDLAGANCTMIGASAIVGKPLALELINHGATVTVCQKETKNLHQHLKNADIVITAIGKPGIIKSEWLKKDCIAIDIGINKVNNKICGDLEFNTAFEKATKITPVPGGVGPITVAMLMQNTLEAFVAKD